MMTTAQTTALANIKEAIGDRVPVDKLGKIGKGVRAHRVNHGEVSPTDITDACSILPESAFAKDPRLAMIRQGSAGGKSDEVVALKLTDLVYLLDAEAKVTAPPATN